MVQKKQAIPAVNIPIIERAGEVSLPWYLYLRWLGNNTGAGEQGPEGPQGPQGEPGPQGPQGEKGTDATINGFSTTTIEAGDNVSVETLDGKIIISSAAGGADEDGLTITKNPEGKIQANGIIDQNKKSVKYDWVGTLAEYKEQDIENKHPDWVCYITDDVNGPEAEIGAISELLNDVVSKSIFNAIYPVGSIYIGTQSVCPMTIAIPSSTWVLVEAGRALWTGNGSNGNTKIAAGLPNITGALTNQHVRTFLSGDGSGALYRGSNVSGYTGNYHESTAGQGLFFDASRSNSIYGKSTTVQPPAYVVNVWRRTA